MGTGVSELTLAQLATLGGAYHNVQFYNDPSDTDLIKTVVGQPRLILINLGQFLNIASGEIQGDALASDEIQAGQIAAGAIGGIELDATPSLFETATTFNQEHDTGAGTILAADANNDRLVIVQAEVTEAFVTTSWEWDIGSTSSSNGLFDDLFAGAAALGLGETVVGAYVLPATEVLAVTETSMVGDSAGIIRFSIIPLTITHAAASIADAAMASSIVKDVGRIAVGRVDFNAEGDEDSTVTVGAVTYAEEHVGTDVTVGEWDNGGAAATSATNLAAGINGDERNSGGPSYAAVAQGTTCWIFALAVGTAGNVAVSASGTDPDVTENLIGGLAAAVKQVALIEHTVSTEEGTQVEVHIPLPFDAASWSFQVVDSSGEDQYVTDVGTVTAASSPIPAFFRLLTNGATHIAATDIIKLVIQD